MKKVICSFLSCNNIVGLETENIIFNKLAEEIDLLIENKIKHFLIGRFANNLDYRYTDYLVQKKNENPDIIIDMVLSTKLCLKNEYIKKYSEYVKNIEIISEKKQHLSLLDLCKRIIDNSNFVIVGYDKSIKIRRTNLIYGFTKYAMDNDKTIKSISV